MKVRPEAGENTDTVWLIDWKHPENNHFAIAEEVTVKAADAKATPSARTSCSTSTASRSACWS